jgi:quercetin dioxygenase-like cupin family protein
MQRLKYFPLITLALVAICLSFGIVVAREFYPAVQPLASGATNIVGEKIVYPTETPAKVTSVIVTLEPGKETGWHTHGPPLFAYIMQGNLEISYRGHPTRQFKPGDSLLEAMTVEHNGRNTGEDPVRILVVFMGAEGVALTTASKLE